MSNKDETKNRTENAISRRTFVNSMATLAAAFGMGGKTVLAAQNSPAIPISAINHMTLAVSDPAASLAWYQGLFGLPIAARQGGTVVLRIGDGPQFMAISSTPSNNPGIDHYCLAVDNFDHTEAVRILAENGVEAANASGPMQSRVRMRGEEFGGAPGGTPELYFGDPDSIVIQLQDTNYCGGAGLLGENCLSTPEPVPTKGLLSIREFNHFTLYVSDQTRSIQFYQGLFGMPIDTYQGALPVLRVGSGNQFLALSSQPARAGRIDHVSLAVDDFDVDRLFSLLESYGLTILGEAGGSSLPLQAYVTMRGADRGGAVEGTPELYFTDPDGIKIQLQDSSYCGGNGYLGDECGTVANPTGRNN
ncbi:MAG: VOC family protein [Proteobacteria bacterium]|nr:VOC family protein [Pseudomonadota bacterium]